MLNYPIYIWATGGLGMQFLGHLIAPENLGSTKENEWFFRNARPSDVSVDHAEHIINNHDRTAKFNISPSIYKNKLEKYKNGHHIVIHPAGFVSYGRTLRIAKHVVNYDYYKSEFPKIKLGDPHRLDSAIKGLEYQDFIDKDPNTFDYFGARQSYRIARHYNRTSNYIQRKGFMVYNIDYYDVLINPDKDKVHRLFHFINQKVDIDEILDKIRVYHEANIELIRRVTNDEYVEKLENKLLTKPTYRV